MASTVNPIFHFLKAALVAGCSIMASHAMAKDLREPDDPWELEYQDEKAWKEEATTLPQPPNERDLISLDAGRAASGTQYLIDLSSLSLKPDQVTRYTVVVESRTGVRNVFHEGIRCKTREYKTYGFVNSQGAFKEISQASWKHVFGHGLSDHRAVLHKHYLCDEYGGPNPPKQVITALRKSAGASRSSRDSGN